MFNRTFALLFVAGLTLVCAGPIAENHHGNGRVVGGETAVPGQFPYLVSIRHIVLLDHCGGAIIASRWVLTAHYCVSNQPAFQVKIVVGALERNNTNSGLEYPVERIVQHEEYNYITLQNNIALVQTVDMMNVNNIVPISSNFIGAGVLARSGGLGVIEVS